jgi:hypothetical protein
MNPDGSGIVKLTHSEDVSDAAGWFPDGSQIAPSAPTDAPARGGGRST